MTPWVVVVLDLSLSWIVSQSNETERMVKSVTTASDRFNPEKEDICAFQDVVMTEALKLPYSVQGRGSVEPIGNHYYRVCGPAGCTVVRPSNALYLSRTVPESPLPNQTLNVQDFGTLLLTVYPICKTAPRLELG